MGSRIISVVAGALNDYGCRLSTEDSIVSNKLANAFFFLSGLCGNVPAYYNLASNLLEKNITSKKTRKAFVYMNKAASLGSPEAQNALGIMYAKGIGTTIDMKSAVDWYRRGAASGNVGAMRNLGYCYHAGDGVAVDYLRAIELYSTAIDAGDPDALYNLGLMFYNGMGVEKNHVVACEMFEDAAEQNVSDASYMVGVCLQGKGMPIEAAEWFQRASQKRDPDLMRKWSQ